MNECTGSIIYRVRKHTHTQKHTHTHNIYIYIYTHIDCTHILIECYLIVYIRTHTLTAYGLAYVLTWTRSAGTDAAHNCKSLNRYNIIKQLPLLPQSLAHGCPSTCFDCEECCEPVLWAAGGGKWDPAAASWYQNMERNSACDNAGYVECFHALDQAAS